MRLLLDAHISGPRIATALRRRGHDLLAADEQRTLDGWPDEDLLALADHDERLFVTFDVKDFPGIVRRWSEAQRAHGGCLIVVGIDHSEYGTIIRVLDGAFAARPEPAEWRDYTAFVARGG